MTAAVRAGTSARAGVRDGVRDRLLPLALAAVALAAVVLSIGPFPVGVFQDDGIYTVLARSLAEGRGYRFINLPGEPAAAHYPPLYPLFLAGLWKLSPSFPANVTIFKFANAVFVAMAAALSWRFAWARVGLGPWSAALSVGAFTVCAPVILLGVMVLSEPMFLAALCPVLMACERVAERGRVRDAVVAGAAIAALAMIRTLGAVALPATALVLAWRRRWLAAAVVCASGLLLMLPWQAWVAAHGAEVPPVFQGKYGSYAGWLGGAIADGGLPWVASLVVFNLRQVVVQGWESMAVDALPGVVRWGATVVVTVLFVLGWWRMVRRAAVTAWVVALYLLIVVSWPFPPARFTWAIWPVVGMVFGLAAQAIIGWRPERGALRAARGCAVALALLLAAGYARYNWLRAESGWWVQLQSAVAERARPLAEWVVTSAPGDAVIATDDDVLIHLYTGRRTIPNGTFTPQEYLRAQTPVFATETLRSIIRAYDVDYVLVASEYGTYAARGLVQADPPELRLIGALKAGAVFAPPGAGGRE